MDHHLISWMILIPFLGALAQAFLPAAGRRKDEPFSRSIALAASVASSVIGIALVATMQSQVAELQANEVTSWVGAYAISYDMGIDGLNALLVLLVSIIFPLLIGSEWSQKLGARGMHGLLLLLQSSLLGAICAQDLFLLFFFWSMAALPFYFLIGIWGGDKREGAAFKSIASAAIGNALFFAALVLIYHSMDPHTFSLRELAGGKVEARNFHFLGNDLPVGTVAFFLVAAGLALRIPVWPLHGWFTRVAEEAPSSVFAALAAVTVPVGTYIFIRLSYSLFPSTVARYADLIVVVGAVNLLLGAVCAIAQRTLNGLLAFICVAEVGLILMGIGSFNSSGVVGAVYQQFALGLGLAGFGLFTGIVVNRTGKSRFLSNSGEPDLGGIALKAPSMAVIAGIVVASLLGFPGFSGFVGHALLIMGSYPAYPWMVLLSALALLMAGFYLLTMYRYVFLGKASDSSHDFSDLTLTERAYLLPLVGCLLVFGLYPRPLIELVRPTVLTLLSTVK